MNRSTHSLYEITHFILVDELETVPSFVFKTFPTEEFSDIVSSGEMNSHELIWRWTLPNELLSVIKIRIS